MSPVELSDVRVAEGNRGGAESYDGEKAWSSLNHSILSGKDAHDIHFTSLRFSLDSSNLDSGKKRRKQLSMQSLCLQGQYPKEVF